MTTTLREALDQFLGELCDCGDVDGCTETAYRAALEGLKGERDDLFLAYNSELDYSKRTTESAKRWIDTLAAEIVELRETVARIEALADRWDEKNYPGMIGIATGIRAALNGTDHCDRGPCSNLLDHEGECEL